jgi:hypothetical protein
VDQLEVDMCPHNNFFFLISKKKKREKEKKIWGVQGGGSPKVWGWFRGIGIPGNVLKIAHQIFLKS